MNRIEPESNPPPSEPPQEVFQARIFYLPTQKLWTALVYSCVDDQNLQFNDQNLASLLQRLKLKLRQKDHTLRQQEPPSVILGLNGEPVKPHANGD